MISTLDLEDHQLAKLPKELLIQILCKVRDEFRRINMKSVEWIQREILEDKEHFIFVTENSPEFLYNLENLVNYAEVPLELVNDDIDYDSLMDRITARMLIADLFLLKVEDLILLNGAGLKSFVHGETFQLLPLAVQPLEKKPLIILSSDDPKTSILYTEASLRRRTKFL